MILLYLIIPSTCMGNASLFIPNQDSPYIPCRAPWPALLLAGTRISSWSTLPAGWMILSYKSCLISSAFILSDVSGPPVILAIHFPYLLSAFIQKVFSPLAHPYDTRWFHCLFLYFSPVPDSAHLVFSAHSKTMSHLLWSAVSSYTLHSQITFSRFNDTQDPT